MAGSDKEGHSNGPKRHKVIATSEHDADFRAGLWEQIEAEWPPLGFGELDAQTRDVLRARMCEMTQGLIMPPSPLDSSPASLVSYEIAIIRETVVQASLYCTVQFLMGFESAGYAPSPNHRRGQWVHYAFYGLHVSLRDSDVVLSSEAGKPLRLELVDGVLRRLAHELPDASAVPADVASTHQRLHLDFVQAHGVYAQFPARWVDGTTPAAPWFLARSCAEHLTDSSREAMSTVPELIAEYARMLADALNGERWNQIVKLLH